MTKVLIGKKLKEILFSAGNNLINSSKEINKINFFPVPDSDTGTNMAITIQSGINNILDLETDDVSLIFQQLSDGMLLGARGNSGIILSQFFFGISEYFKKKVKVTVKNFLKSFAYGYQEAYNAVYDPKDGTILTVIQKISKSYRKFKHLVYFEDFFLEFLKTVEKLVAETTLEMDLLKEKQVVDAGSLGLLKIFEGMKEGFFDNKILNHKNFDENLFSDNTNLNYLSNEFSVDHGYCTEFLILLSKNKEKNFNLENFKKEFKKDKFDSVVVVQNSKILKVHAHTKDPGKLLNIGTKYGQLLKIKIDNMNFQSETHVLFSKENIEKLEEPEITENNDHPEHSGLFLVTDCKNMPDIFKDSYLKDIIVLEKNDLSLTFIDAIKKKYLFKNYIFLTDIVDLFKIIDKTSKNSCYAFFLDSIIYALPLVYSFSPEEEPKESLNIFKELSNEISAIYLKNFFQLPLYDLKEFSLKEDFFFFILENEKIIDKSEDKVKLLINVLEKNENEIFEGITIFLSLSFSEKEKEQILNFLKQKKYKWELFSLLMPNNEGIIMIN